MNFDINHLFDLYDAIDLDSSQGMVNEERNMEAALLSRQLHKELKSSGYYVEFSPAGRYNVVKCINGEIDTYMAMGIPTLNLALTVKSACHEAYKQGQANA